MRILVLGSYFSNNLGDGVICECVAKRLQYHFPDAQIKIMDLKSRDSFCPAREEPMKAARERENRSQLRRIATRLGWDKMYAHECNMIRQERAHFEKLARQECDAVVFAGGQMFMDSYALRLENVVKTFSQRETPLLFNACGVGPSCSVHIRDRLSQALSDPWVKMISSRDDAELVNRKYLAAERQAIVTYDPALWSGEVYQTVRRQSGVVGLGIMYPSHVNFRAACRFWKRLITELESRGTKWKMFVNGSGTDLAFARYVHSLIPGLNRPFEDCIAPVPGEPQALVELIAGFESIISFRLHSHIIAASLDIPSVAMVWDNKLPFFFEKIGHPERCCTVADSPQKVLKKLVTAKSEGYDRELLKEQKQFADALLYEGIRNAVK